MTTTSTSELDVRPMTSFLGAEVGGVDLSADVDDLVIDALLATLRQWRVVSLPGQAVNARGLLAFATRWYPDGEAATDAGVLTGPGAGDQWRIDSSFGPSPPSVLMVRCDGAPSSGGDTLWTNLAAAHEHLSPPVQRMMEGLRAVHEADGLSALHPVAMVHPDTGERVVYVDEASTTHIPDMSARESAAILKILVAQISLPAFTVRLRWRPDTVVIWDNVATAFRSLPHGGAGWTGHCLTVRPRPSQPSEVFP